MDLIALCDGEISVLRGDTTLHYIVFYWNGFILLNQAPHAEGHGQQCFLLVPTKEISIENLDSKLKPEMNAANVQLILQEF